MLYRYTFHSTGFQDWLSCCDQLYRTKYLEMGGQKKGYLPLKVDPHPYERYLMYIDDEAGVCGSAALTPFPDDIKIFDQVILQGTWTLRNVLFHIRAGHPLQEQPDKFVRIAKKFYLSLFEEVWHVAQKSSQSLILSVQNDPEEHEDLQFFGGFCFEHEVQFQDGDQVLSIGTMPLTKKIYQNYERIRKKNL